MPPRLTRSAARLAASQTAAQSSASASAPAPGAAPADLSTTPAGTGTTPDTQTTPTNSRKRKSPPKPDTSPSSETTLTLQPSSSARRSKRQKGLDPTATQNSQTPTPAKPQARKGNGAAMSGQEDSSGAFGAGGVSTPSASSSQSLPAGAHSSSTRRSRRNAANPADQDTAMTGTDDTNSTPGLPPPPPPAPADEDHPTGDDSDDMDEDDSHRYDDGDDDGPFGAFGGHPSNLSNTLRALTSMISGISSRLRDIYNSLRQKDEFIQQAALQELSEILLVSNEDNLSGHFSPDSFVKELVSLMQAPNNPEVMLLACRCLANLMEALPASVANVVYGGAVPVLCSKLLEISFIDVAEQSLSTLEKISTEYPSAIVREGGLTACLSYLDFFATSTQRTAVTTAANCCRNIPEDSFHVVRDVMPKLQDVLGSSDQRVVEQASLCVTGIVESFRYHPSKLEQLVDIDLLRAILRLLVPGTTNLIGPNIHTQFLRVLAFTARASPRLSADLFRLNVVETLYQILTGVSPPDGTEDVASKLDSVVIMQALIHRPREQILETLNVICELLPNFPRILDPTYGHLNDTGILPDSLPPAPSGGSGKSRKSSNDKRIEMLDECKSEVRRFALILFPTLTDAFSSTVNLNVRQKVLTAQLKMLSNLDVDILIEALKSVPYASFLAAILSQQDHSSLVVLGLHATELLVSRLDEIYRYQLYREGVMAEITKLASEEDVPAASPEAGADEENKAESPASVRAGDKSENEASEGEEDEERGTSDEENDDEDVDGAFPRPDDGTGSPVSSRGSTMSIDDNPHQHVLSELQSTRSIIRKMAKKFLETHETEKQSKIMKKKATKILDDLSGLAGEVEKFYLQPTSGNRSSEAGIALFKKLASYFDADVLESVTSAELLASGLVRVLLEVFSNPDESLARAAQTSFLRVFMGNDTPATPFSVMVKKLQDLLSRSEHFEVITVHNSLMDGSRSSAVSMLGKQIRLRLMADEDADIPRPYRNIVVSIQAIATFQSLDDYLRPRISITERARSARREGISKALAAMAAGTRPLPPFAGSSSSGRLVDRSASGSGSSSGAPPSATPSSARGSRKSKSRSGAQSDAPSTPSTSSREKRALRRSSNRQDSSTEGPAAPLAPPEEEDDLQDALECADEKPLSDDGEDLGEEPGPFDEIAGELDEDMGDDPAGDPSAVSLEVVDSGKVTARNEDGTRVQTPGGAAAGRTPSRRTSPPAPSAQPTPTPSSSRPRPSPAVMQASPQDWHVEFSVDGKTIGNDTTIYRAIYQMMTAEDHTSRSIWSQVHSIKFKRVPGPPPQESSSSFTSPADANAEPTVDGIPASLAKHPATASILRLLRILHDLNANLEDVLVENAENLHLTAEPLSQFVNTKLTAKLNRQLEEPLIVASNCLPSWSEDLARLYPFLFPFETRHLFLQSTSFGYARSMTRWQNAQSAEETRRDRRDERPFLGRLQRQKVRIGRSKILESALKVMELYGASQSILEVEYFEEVGTGLGPTLEFYSTISKEFSKKKLKLWREVDSNDSDEYIHGSTGLFPRPISDEEALSPNGERVLHLFTSLGKFVARSMLDSRIIDINLNPIFFRIGDESSPVGIKPSLGAVKAVDPGLARSLKTIKKFATAKKEIDEDPNRTPAEKVAATENIIVHDTKIDDLCLDFTLPGYPEIELVPSGSQIRVTISNVEDYLDRVIDMTLGSGVRRQIDAFRTGFTRVFPYSALSAFTPDELVSLFGRVDEDWSLETLMDSIKADHGYNMDSRSVRNLLQTMSELTPSQRRDFLQFTTGSPKLPIGGFKSLTPMFTVVCKPSEHPYTSDDYLPSVMTCVNYLKLPDYTSVEIMQKQLFMAMREGQGAFHLS
ncbi:related to rat ubiquitin ligase Nedd4 [Cephalotrichum gorgonifer]|uniref:HECT-type E3 ubiquitin transferase n=1 Tax=Cephalotrichum gorgonifer TaxID=2041049 RepID=A0AAE8N1X2_9PEZI|nr:related to rat ubiquitin ligase Nedd4 [Cephalotrichum gorgonifer]